MGHSAKSDTDRADTMTVIGRAIIEEVTGTETAVQRGTEAGEEMTATNDTVVGEETTTTTDVLDTMMIDEVDIVDGETRKGEEASEMTEAGTVAEAVEVEAEEGASVKAPVRQSGDHQLPKALCPCRKENAKHLAGMFMPQVTSNIPPCKRSKQVRHIRLLPKLVMLRNVFFKGCSTFLVPTERKSRLFLESLGYLLQCLFRPLAWVSALIRTSQGSRVVFISAASPPILPSRTWLTSSIRR